MTAGLRDIGALIKVDRAAANIAVTAGGAGDNTLVTGAIIDRAAQGWPESAVLAIPYTVTLAAAQSLTISGVIQEGDAANLSDAVTHQTIAATIVATGAGTFNGVMEVSVPLRGCKRYLRANFTPDLSAATIDTAALAAVLVFGGANRVPV